MAVSGEKPHAPGSVRLALGTQVVRIEPKQVTLKDDSGKETVLPNDVVFTMIGREAPLEFFRRSGIPIRGEWKAATYASFAAFFLFCIFLYNWKAGGAVNQFFQKHELFPYNTTGWFARAGGSIAAAAQNPRTLLGTLALVAQGAGLLLLARLLHGGAASSASGASAAARRRTSQRRRSR